MIVRAAVVDTDIETQFINNIATFFSTAGNTHRQPLILAI